MASKTPNKKFSKYNNTPAFKTSDLVKIIKHWNAHRQKKGTFETHSYDKPYEGFLSLDYANEKPTAQMKEFGSRYLNVMVRDLTGKFRQVRHDRGWVQTQSKVKLPEQKALKDGEKPSPPGNARFCTRLYSISFHDEEKFDNNLALRSKLTGNYIRFDTATDKWKIDQRGWVFMEKG